MAIDIDNLRDKFETLYGLDACGAVRAPGRVNLIGEHTDYNGGFVLPIAIERETLALFARREDRKVNFASRQAQERAQIDLDGPIEPGEPHWANYCKGVAAGLVRHGVPLAGADILFSSDVPLGGGLSSSAALEVAAAMALLAAAGKVGALEPRELARLCQKAEHDFTGAPCGIMDQSIAVMGQVGNALLLDCCDGQARQIPFDDPATVVLVADTQVKHAINDGGYAARRQQCFAAATRLGVRTLRDAAAMTISRAQFAGKLEGEELMRARHVVGEIDRTLKAAEALKEADYKRFGELMYASHASLRDNYEVSCEELDLIVEAATKCKGVYGARMTGGGFGGCAIILASFRRQKQIVKAIQSAFADKFGQPCPIFATHAAAGASVIA